MFLLARGAGASGLWAAPVKCPFICINTTRLEKTTKNNEAGETYSAENKLVDACFINVKRTSFHSFLSLDTYNAYVIPVSYNTYFREGNVVTNELHYHHDLISPLMEEIARFHSKWLGMKYTRDLDVDYLDHPIKFLTVPSASISKGGFKTKELWTEEADGNLWLYLTQQGVDQAKLAEDYLNAMNYLFGRQDLRYSNNALEEIDVGYRNTPRALWATLVSHQKHYPLTCKQCKRTVLSTTQGPSREFCSDVCRATYNKARRQPPTE